MPTIAYLLGISVRMFFNDHEPPHIHVRYQGFRARVRIEDGSVIDGRLPLPAARILREWIGLRRASLMHNWRLARLEQPLEQVPGLE
jgi:hypothetical protein